MIVLDMAWIRIKQVFREKEFFFYVLGFPIFFLILFGLISASWVPKVVTMDIGVYSTDIAVIDPLTDETLKLDVHFIEVLNSYTSEAGVKTFAVSNYDNLAVMDDAIENRVIRGGLEIPSNFSEQAASMTRFYSSMILVQLLSEQYADYFLEVDNITNAINELSFHLDVTANLILEFRGDITVETTMQAYTSVWQVLSTFINNYTVTHANAIWQEVRSTHGLSFDLEINQEVMSNSSISFDVQLVSAGDGSVALDFRNEYLTNLIPGQIVQSITMASVSAIWMIDNENKKGLLKRLKLTRLSAAQYMGSILLAWSVIAIFQGLLLLIISAIFGFFAIGFNPVAWLFMLITMVLLGIISATIALIVGSFVNARIAAPFMIFIFSTFHMFIGEFFFQVDPLFTFAGKTFTGFDVVPFRPAFLVLKNGMRLESLADLGNMWFDLVLLVIWTVVIFALGAFLFNKFKLKYAEEE